MWYMHSARGYPTLMPGQNQPEGMHNLNVDESSTQTKQALRMSAPNNSDDWIAEVSHELRLPIANIRLLIETLLNGALEDKSTATRMLLRAQGEVERLQSLVADLLSVEQLAATRLEVQAEWLPLEARAKYAVESTAKAAAELGVKVVLAITPGFKVFANSSQLDQVILNLLENAIKFSEGKGTVTVRSGERDGIFAVEDTGIGMPASEIPKIFQRFYRIDRARTRGSTGLGLSIVKHILDLHGAKITVTSQEGKGSSFLVEFPDPRAASSLR
jgi:two-component system phosphate regulon sensor histidine kinase PhoR